uniref:phosphatidylinositol-3,5-bisphosphate 3-phosphatase n=1 Tax=Cyprinus carpio TaxID=7962 RepID=A0A8C2KT23_CYPCA
QEEEGQQSLECIQANQIFPRKPPVLDDDDLQVPFPELHGEFTTFVGRAEDAIIAMSSYRLHIKFKESVVNVPLQLIESVECRDMFQMHITCKDCKVIRCQFSTFEQCQEWLKRLNAAVRPPSQIEELFSFAFHAWCVEKEQHGDLCRPGDHVLSRFHNEVERMGFDTQNAWRVSEINNKYKLCSSYPQLLLVPAWITDKELENVAAFRSWKRIPAVVYRHQSTGAVIARCGQPEVSWWGWRNADDEHLVQSIARACAVDSSSCKGVSNGSFSREYTNGADLSDVDFDSSMTNSSEVETLAIQPRKLLILDARSYAAAVANRAKGGGCECPEYYPNCEVVFMGMANIHSIRKSFQSLRFLCTQMPDPANWLSALESTKWLQHLSLLLKASLLVVNAVDRDHRPVLVHCSDGWDRTPQIVALAKVLLDPYYRTIEGFQVLVETEWLDFGHKFADRCGHGENAEDLNERCPVFLQWLDCVHQLQRQFPCSFEFNEAFLVLHPVCHVRNLMLWTAVYLPSSSPTTPSDDSCAKLSQELGSILYCAHRRPKTRSFDNLPSACEVGNPLTSNRRSSDPSVNEKWQDHRRSLEINIGTGADGAASPDSDERVNGQTVVGLMGTLPNGGTENGEGLGDVRLPVMEGVGEAELIVGVAVGQMENILQEATKDDSPPDSHRDTKSDHTNKTSALNGQSDDVARSEEGSVEAQLTADAQESKAKSLGDANLNRHFSEDGSSEASPALSQENSGSQDLEEVVEKLAIQENNPSRNTNNIPPSGLRTVSNGHGRETVEQEKRLSLLESSTETLTEDLGVRPESLGPLTIPPPLKTLAESSCLKQGLRASTDPRTLNNTPKHPSLSAFPPSTDLLHPVCNGDSPDPEPSTPQWAARTNEERATLSRQVSLASCGSLTLHTRGACSHHRCLHLGFLGRPSFSPPEPPSSRSHLDDDGLTLHTDAVQQRLRQIEAGHQLEVEALKRQVQELWSRLESHQAAGILRLNGDMGDEVVSSTHSVTELFSEASWEQVDKQDTEVTRWYPDHLAAQCYGCERGFWLATRRHHCRNCGNVFCASCCDQKIPVPSQQLFEPSRVCKSCFSSLQPPAPPLSIELDKPITASSN